MPEIKVRSGTELLPLEDRVLVRPDHPEERTEFGLLLPENAQEPVYRGQVLAVGPGRVERGERVPMPLAEGDTVIYKHYAGFDVTLPDGSEARLIPVLDVLARVYE